MKFRFGQSQPSGESERGKSERRPAQTPLLDSSRPAPAERARTTLAGASSVRLGVAAGGAEVVRHVIASDGSLLLVVGEYSPVVSTLTHGVGGHLPAHVPTQVRAVDVSPLTLPERVRGVATVTGRLSLLAESVPEEVVAHLLGPDAVWADRPIVRLVPRRVVLHDPQLERDPGPVEIDLDAYREARTDPLVGAEEGWLEHLDHEHRDVLGALAGVPTAHVRPVSVGRLGILLRVAHPARHVWVPFEVPVGCACDLPEAIHALMLTASPAPFTGSDGRPHEQR